MVQGLSANDPKLLTNKHKWKWYWLLLVATLLGGFLLGIRLAYAPLLVPLLYTGWFNCLRPTTKQTRPLPLVLAIALLGLAFLLPISLWLGWQLWMDTPARFFTAISTDLNGHYTAWGNTITTNSDLLGRLSQLLKNDLAYGLGMWWPASDFAVAWWRGPATLILLLLLGVGGMRLAHPANTNTTTAAATIINNTNTTTKTSSISVPITIYAKSIHCRPALILALLWLVPYSIGVLITLDIDQARYSLPVVALLCILAGIGLPKLTKLKPPSLASASPSFQCHQWRSLNLAWLVTIVVTIGLVSIPLALAHRTEAPIGQNLVNYVQTELDPSFAAVIISDETPLLFFYMQDEIPKFLSLRLGQADMAAALNGLESQGRTVFITTLASTDPNQWGNSGQWIPEIKLCRSAPLESSGPFEVELYRHVSAQEKEDNSALTESPSLAGCN
jgi:hypothetical protein